MNNTPQRLRASLLGGALFLLRTFISGAFLSGALLSAPVFAQAPESTEATETATTDEKASKRFAEWDVLQPPFPLNTVNVKSTEVTWASLDVTPDGKSIVFDTVGDIFISSIDGGDAQALTQDFAWNIHPAVSPNGKQIAFISDRDGLSNVWVMNIDGSDLRQVTKEKNNIIHSPKWSPDGQYIVVTKGIMSSRSIPAGEILR